MRIVNTDYCPATNLIVDDTPRYIVRVAIDRSEANRENIAAFSRDIIERLKAERGFFAAVTVFFWMNCDPVGEVQAKASITYAPGGKWDNAIGATKATGFAGFEFSEDFYAFCDSCWCN